MLSNIRDASGAAKEMPRKRLEDIVVPPREKRAPRKAALNHKSYVEVLNLGEDSDEEEEKRRKKAVVEDDDDDDDLIILDEPPSPPPVKRRTTPLSRGRGRPPTRGGTPFGRGASPIAQGGTPIGRGGTPVGRGGTPVGRGGTPVGRGGTPVGRGGTPVGRGGTPVGRGGTPVGRGGTSVSRGGTPVGRGGTQVGRGGTTVGRGGTPVNRGGTPTGRGGTPIGTKPRVSTPIINLQKRRGSTVDIELMMECCDDDLSPYQKEAARKAEQEYQDAVKRVQDAKLKAAREAAREAQLAQQAAKQAAEAAAAAAKAKAQQAALEKQVALQNQARQRSIIAPRTPVITSQHNDVIILGDSANTALQQATPTGSAPLRFIIPASQAGRVNPQQPIFIQQAPASSVMQYQILNTTSGTMIRPTTVSAQQTAVPTRQVVSSANNSAITAMLRNTIASQRPATTSKSGSVVKTSIVPGTGGLGIKRLSSAGGAEPPPTKKVAPWQVPRKPTSESSIEKGSNWVPLDEYYYGKKEGDPAYREEKAEFRFKCWYCHKMLYSNLHVMIHMQSHIDSEKQQNLDLSDLTTCKHCYKTFDTPFELQCHVEKVHQSNTNSLVCRICEKDHDTQQALTQHMKCLHNACEMPYICQLCNFRSSFYCDVVDHFKKRHDSSEYVMCLYCLRVFKINFSKANGWGLTQNYYQHLQRHQVKGNIKKCNCCKLAFLNKQDTKTHRQKDHMPNQKGILGKLGGSQGLPLPRNEQVMIKVPDAASGRKNSQYKSLNAPTHMKTKDFRDLRMAVTQLMEVTCLECRQPMSVSDHFRKYVECSMCRFATSCSFAYANHMIGFHSGMAQVVIGNIPEERKMERAMFCLCGFTSQYGNSIANHMVFCSKRTCYSSKPEVRWIEYDDGEEEESSFDAYEKKVPDPMSRPGASILDVLGLVKKSSRPTVTVEESPSLIVTGILNDLLDHVFPAESLASELVGNILAKLPEEKVKRSMPLVPPDNDDIPPEFTGARKWSTVKIDDIKKPSQASVFLGSAMDEDTMDSRDSRDDSVGDLDLGSGVDTTDDSTRDGEREEEEEEEDDDHVLDDDDDDEEMTRDEEDVLLGSEKMAESAKEDSNTSGKISESSTRDVDTPMDTEEESSAEKPLKEEEEIKDESKDGVKVEVDESSSMVEKPGEGDSVENQNEPIAEEKEIKEDVEAEEGVKEEKNKTETEDESKEEVKVEADESSSMVEKPEESDSVTNQNESDEENGEVEKSEPSQSELDPDSSIKEEEKSEPSQSELDAEPSNKNEETPESSALEKENDVTAKDVEDDVGSAGVEDSPQTTEKIQESSENVEETIEDVGDKADGDNENASEESAESVENSGKSVVESEELVEKIEESVEESGESVEKIERSEDESGESVEKTGESVEVSGGSVDGSGEPMDESEKSVEASRESVEESQESVEESVKPEEVSGGSVDVSGEPMDESEKSVEASGESVKSVEASGESVEEFRTASLEESESVEGMTTGDEEDSKTAAKAVERSTEAEKGAVCSEESSVPMETDENEAATEIAASTENVEMHEVAEDMQDNDKESVEEEKGTSEEFTHEESEIEKPVEEEMDILAEKEDKEDKPTEKEVEEKPESEKIITEAEEKTESEKVITEVEEKKESEKVITEAPVKSTELYSEPISSPGTPVMDEMGPGTPLQDEAPIHDPKISEPTPTSGVEESTSAPEESSEPEKSLPHQPEEPTEKNPPKTEFKISQESVPMHIPSEAASFSNKESLIPSQSELATVVKAGGDGDGLVKESEKSTTVTEARRGRVDESLPGSSSKAPSIDGRGDERQKTQDVSTRSEEERRASREAPSGVGGEKQSLPSSAASPTQRSSSQDSSATRPGKQNAPARSSDDKQPSHDASQRPSAERRPDTSPKPSEERRSSQESPRPSDRRPSQEVSTRDNRGRPSQDASPRPGDRRPIQSPSSSQDSSPRPSDRRPPHGSPEGAARRGMDDRGYHKSHDNRHHDNRHHNRPYDRDRRDDRGYQGGNRGYDNRDRYGGYQDNRYGGQGGYGNQGRNRNDRGHQDDRGYRGRGGYNQNRGRGQGYRGQQQGGYRGGYY